MRLIPVLALSALSFACDRAAGLKAAPGANSAALPTGKPVPELSVVSAEPASVRETILVSPWSPLLRAERWEDAARALDNLPDTERAGADVRFARARVALELGDHARTLTLLENLEQELPALASQIEQRRAEAQLAIGPYEEAARYYSAKSDAASQLNVATAYERAGELQKARIIVDKLIAKAATRARSTETVAKARNLRVRLAEQRGETLLAASDLRWLALRVPQYEAGRDADTRLEAIAPRSALTKSERFGRARVFAEEGMIESMERELELLAKAPGVTPSAAEQGFVRGWAWYKSRRDYLRAAELFEAAARAGSVNEPRDLFYAARSLSRANQDQRAIEDYLELSRRFPKSSFAEQARYLAARLQFLAGNWEEATRLYDDYLVRYMKNARHGEDARYERAIAWLVSGKADRAAALLAMLTTRTTNARELARFRHLQAVALLNLGKKDEAVQKFEEVVREYPLSFFALASAARLEAMGVHPPAPIAPNTAVRHVVGDAIDPELPALPLALHRVGLDRDAENELGLLEPSIRRALAPRGDEALCELYGRLGVGSRRFRVAQDVIRAEALDVAPNGNRWAWECIYPQPYADVVESEARERDLKPALIWAVMRQESSFRPDVTSPVGARGLMQLMPDTAQRVATLIGQPAIAASVQSPAYNVRLGTAYLRYLLDTFSGNIVVAVAAYNAGPRAAYQWLGGSKDLALDLFVSRIPFDETRNYVERVIGNYARYSYLEGGAAAVPKLDLALPSNVTLKSDAF